MNKILLTVALIAASTQLAQSREKEKSATDEIFDSEATTRPVARAKRKAPVEEKVSVVNLYRPIPRSKTDPNAPTGWRISIMKPTQHYYTKNSVISYRYTQKVEHADSMLEGYMGPRSATFIPSNDFTAPGAGLRSYASINPRIQPGVPMAPHTEIPVKPADKAKKIAQNAETSIELVQQR